MECGVVRIGNMDYEKGRYQKIRGFRDVDLITADIYSTDLLDFNLIINTGAIENRYHTLCIIICGLTVFPVGPCVPALNYVPKIVGFNANYHFGLNYTTD